MFSNNIAYIDMVVNGIKDYIDFLGRSRYSIHYTHFMLPHS